MDSMNWKIILSGSLLIIVAFFSYVGYITLDKNKKEISQQSEINFYEQSQLSSQSKEVIKNEIQFQNQLIRGRVSAYNPTNNTISLVMHQKQQNGDYLPIGLIDVIIDEDRVKQFLCWPEYFAAESDNPIDISTAYMPFGPDSKLFIQGETEKQINDLPTYLENKPFLFVVLNTAINDSLELIQDTSTLGPQYASQLAILGCNE